MDTLTAGTIGEVLVELRLLKWGHLVNRTVQVTPYDLIVDFRGDLIRIQVKATRKPMRISKTHVQRKYQFHSSRNSYGNSTLYPKSAFDVIAYVALDKELIHFEPGVPKVAILRLPIEAFTKKNENKTWQHAIKHLKF